MLKRYLHGPGVDEPLAWFDGATTNPANRHDMFADSQGSIVAVINSSGTTEAVNRYDEFGIPGAGQTSRFQYTGQAWVPELGVYYYKARMYSPTLGRFLQTDPIGYGDGPNWYNYVGSDPVNGRDPSGLAFTCNFTPNPNNGLAGTESGGQVTCSGGPELPELNPTTTKLGDFLFHSERFNFDQLNGLPNFPTGFTFNPEGSSNSGNAMQQKKNPPQRPAYCDSALNKIGGALDSIGKIQQVTAVAAIVFTAGAATEGAAPAYALGTALRYSGQTLQSISGNSAVTVSLISSGVALPARLTPVGDFITGGVADYVLGKTIPDNCKSGGS
jgi:RHS repeat-associated protein